MKEFPAWAFPHFLTNPTWLDYVKKMLFFRIRRVKWSFLLYHSSALSWFLQSFKKVPSGFPTATLLPPRVWQSQNGMPRMHSKCSSELFIDCYNRSYTLNIDVTIFHNLQLLWYHYKKKTRQCSLYLTLELDALD